MNNFSLQILLCAVSFSQELDIHSLCLSQAPLYWDLYVPKGLNSARICFTCHNFEYQGNAPASQLASCGLDVDQLNRPDRMQDHSGHDRVNPVKVQNLELYVVNNICLDSFSFRWFSNLSSFFFFFSGCSCFLQHCDNSITNLCTRGSNC